MVTNHVHWTCAISKVTKTPQKAQVAKLYHHRYCDGVNFYITNTHISHNKLLHKTKDNKNKKQTKLVQLLHGKKHDRYMLLAETKLTMPEKKRCRSYIVIAIFKWL